ncbi:olfactory receptor 52D1-like [Rhinophrynus dorsalis]
MQNVTYLHPSVLTLGFGEMSEIKYLYSAFVLVGFVMIVLSNSAVIIVVVSHQALHEPMYIFICVLCINGLYGSISFFPSLFVNLLCKTQTISYVGCLTQLFCIHTYSGCEMSILAIMAFDRYLCICNPLRYHNIMSFSTVFKLIVSAWFYIIVPFTVQFILTILLPLCGSAIEKIYCDNFSVVKLSCVDTSVNNIYGLFITVGVLAVMPVLIMFSYIEILRVCAKSSKDYRTKALQTCTPHLIIMVNYVADLLFEVLLHRFSPRNLPYEIKIIMSVQGLIVTPLLNPLMYGLKMREIRVKIAQLYHVRRTAPLKTQLWTQ